MFIVNYINQKFVFLLTCVHCGWPSVVGCGEAKDEYDYCRMPLTPDEFLPKFLQSPVCNISSILQYQHNQEQLPSNN